MRKTSIVLSLMFMIFAFAPQAYAQNFCAEKTSGYKPITKQLINIIEHNAELKSLLVKSIEKAKSINPSRATNPAQSLEEYYTFIDWASEAIPWMILKGNDDIGLYNKLDQSLAYFYFIGDIPLKELEGRGYYNNSLQYHEPYRSWAIAFTKEYGAFLDTEKSWNDRYLKNVFSEPAFGLENNWYEDASNWKTFNDFFARKLDFPDKRPIASLDNDAVVISPVDSTPQGAWFIDKSSNIIQNAGVLIKSRAFNSVASLIGEGSAYIGAFANGTVTHTRLAPTDYHRFHFPVSGTIKEMRIIPAANASGGTVTWDPYLEKYIISYETPGWQSIETRGCLIIETKEYGLVALLPVGTGHRSSVNFEKELKPNIKVTKGEMMGYFLFGGSDFVMIFQKKAGFRITAEKNISGETFSHIRMGAEYGRMNK